MYSSGGIMKHSNQTREVTRAKKGIFGFKRPLKVSPLELTSIDEVKMEGEGLDLFDSHFQSELQYDGYGNLESYDNHTLDLDLNGKGDPEKELNFDPQGNH